MFASEIVFARLLKAREAAVALQSCCARVTLFEGDQGCDCSDKCRPTAERCAVLQVLNIFVCLCRGHISALDLPAVLCLNSGSVELFRLCIILGCKTMCGKIGIQLAQYRTNLINLICLIKLIKLITLISLVRVESS